MTILELNHVGFRYRPDRPVLEDVNCRFETGVFYALVGKSGAGKSTLLSLMAGLDLPTEGEILFEGRSTAGMDLSEYRRRYASVIYQDFALLPLLTVQENIQYPMALCGVPPQEAAQQARDLDRRLLLADEPTGNLDSENSDIVIDLLRRLAHEEDRCVIVVTHDLSVMDQADVTYRVRDHRLERR